jgi:hypothetical protein
MTTRQLLAPCEEHGVDPSLPLPSSLLEAEAVHRNVPPDTPVREHLLRRREEAGVL